MFYHLTQLGGRDIDHGHVDDVDVGVVGSPLGNAAVMTWIDGYLVVVENVVMVCPLMEFGEVVAPDDEDEVVLRIVCLEMLQGVPGIGGALQMELIV